MRYIVLAFYPGLKKIPIRTTGYTNKRDMYEYISGLRMCETPYVALDQKAGTILDKEVYALGGKEMARMLEEENEKL